MSRRRVRRTLIRELTQDLLAAKKMRKPAVNVHRIAKLEGIRIIELETDDSMSGFLDRSEEIPLIAVNKAHSKPRQRFTIAHELGHYFLHPSKSIYFDDFVRFRNGASSEGKDVDEVEANLFAAELLMPEDLLESAVLQIPHFDIEDDDQVKKLARRFDVSTQALLYRLAYLRIA